MADYKELFYKSQTVIADSIDIMNELKESLIACMQELEQEAAADEETDTEKTADA